MISIQQNRELNNIHFDFIKKFIITRINKIVNSKNPRIKKNKIFIPLSSPNKLKLTNLLEEGVLEEIIKAPPNKLKNVIKKYRIYNTDSNLSVFINNIFVYHGYEKINKFNFIRNIGLNTCPYCNRGYIYTIEKSKKTKPEIDHFYPKDKFPLLGVSFYNLIPSCPTCNGFGAKGNLNPIDKNMKSPYEIKDDDFKFSFEIKDTSILNSLSNSSSDALEICFEKQIDGNTEVFKLDDLYKEHYDVILELYYKSKQQYTKQYIEQLKSIYPEFSEAEINRLLIGNYTNPNEFHMRPLSKLMTDIGKKLDLL